jgi:hypothetical protein
VKIGTPLPWKGGGVFYYRIMRILASFALAIFSLSAHAVSELHVSHLQHAYAGGGGCAERFWLLWDDLKSEITNIELLVEVYSKGQENMTGTLHIDRLGVATADNRDEASFETPQCPSGRPKLTILAASGNIQGIRVDLLKRKMLRIDRVQTFPLRISGSPHNPRIYRNVADHTVVSSGTRQTAVQHDQKFRVRKIRVKSFQH